MSYRHGIVIAGVDPWPGRLHRGFDLASLSGRCVRRLPIKDTLRHYGLPSRPSVQNLRAAYMTFLRELDGNYPPDPVTSLDLQRKDHPRKDVHEKGEIWSLHGNSGEFRLVKQALQERQTWERRNRGLLERGRALQVLIFSAEMAAGAAKLGINLNDVDEESPASILREVVKAGTAFATHGRLWERRAEEVAAQVADLEMPARAEAPLYLGIEILSQ